MATNIEIKARVADLETLRKRVEAMSGSAGELITQEDIFFHVPQGRLKLRILNPDFGQLIYYQRPNQAGPKRSNYLLANTQEPQALQTVLSAALGVRGRVNKERWLYWIGQTRVHLDQVEGLGSFMELEVVLADGDTPAEGQAIARSIMEALELQPDNLIAGAYIDLLGA